MYNYNLRLFALVSASMNANNMLLLENEGDRSDFSNSDYEKAQELGDKAFRDLLSLCRDFGIRVEEPEELLLDLFDTRGSMEQYFISYWKKRLR